MDVARFLATGCQGLALLSDAETRSISAENPDGSRAGGARALPDSPNHAAARLGKGWKVSPYINIPAGETAVLMDAVGPGTIQHFWITCDPKLYLDGVLRIYWDGEETPSVEVPLGDFFAQGHGLRYDVNSLLVCSNPDGGLNCYWPMPFASRARITLQNQRAETVNGIYYQITYELGPVPDAAARFHAQWRRSMTTREHPEHTLLDSVTGHGHYVGTHCAWTQLSNGWWGEGEIKFYIDGDQEYPTICGTGTEDYFGGAWCFADRTYSTPFLGYPLFRREPNEVPRHGLYRWHTLDPVRFKQDLRVTIQALGWWPDGKFQPLTDDIATVAYWYQTEPHAPVPPFPPPENRWSR